MGSFNDILYNIKTRLVLPFQHDLKNILNKVTWNMKATSKELQKQASLSVVDIKLGFMMWFFFTIWSFDQFYVFTNVCKKGFEIYFILFRSWIICKNKKSTGFYTFTKTSFITISRSKQNKKNSEYPFLGIAK